MHPARLTALAMLLGVAGAAWGGPVFTGDSAVRYALEKNRTLAAARLMLAAAEARARGAGRLANPDLEIVVAGGQDFEGRIEVGLMQRFPLTARLRLEKEISALEIEAARCEIAEQERTITGQVRGGLRRADSHPGSPWPAKTPGGVEYDICRFAGATGDRGARLDPRRRRSLAGSEATPGLAQDSGGRGDSSRQ